MKICFWKYEPASSKNPYRYFFLETPCMKNKFICSSQSNCKLQVYYMSTKTKFNVIYCNIHIFVYGSAESATISLECTKVKLLILNNFDIAYQIYQTSV